MNQTTARNDAPPYTLAETISQLRWHMRGKRIYPIELGLSAAHWLHAADSETMGAYPMTFAETTRELDTWIGNEDPNLPEPLIEAALYWLRASQKTTVQP